MLKAKLDSNNVFSICSNIENFERKNYFTIYQSVPKKKSLEILVQKLTEIGISKIVLFFSSYSFLQKINLMRLLEISRFAAIQSRNIFLPQIIINKNPLSEIQDFHLQELILCGRFLSSKKYNKKKFFYSCIYLFY